jgi:hypothetical protein
MRSRREPASSSSNKHSHVLCQDPCLEYHFGTYTSPNPIPPHTDITRSIKLLQTNPCRRRGQRIIATWHSRAATTQANRKQLTDERPPRRKTKGHKEARYAAAPSQGRHLSTANHLDNRPLASTTANSDRPLCNYVCHTASVCSSC